MTIPKNDHTNTHHCVSHQSAYGHHFDQFLQIKNACKSAREQSRAYTSNERHLKAWQETSEPIEYETIACHRVDNARQWKHLRVKTRGQREYGTD
jgi:hypothetical protein